MENNIRKKPLNQLAPLLASETLCITNRLQAQREYVISNQVSRSATSVGANISEAKYAQSRLDFISKMEIALKEINETIYWFGLLHTQNAISDDEFSTLNNLANVIKSKLIASIKTVKNSF